MADLNKQISSLQACLARMTAARNNLAAVLGDAMEALGRAGVAWTMPDGPDLPPLLCADCGAVVSGTNEPADGWQLEDGRTVCGACCAADLRRVAETVATLTKGE